jgi:hypothetical protein
MVFIMLGTFAHSGFHASEQFPCVLIGVGDVDGGNASGHQRSPFFESYQKNRKTYLFASRVAALGGPLRRC